MPKKFYCSNCGIELKHSRRAIKGKGLILDLIDPHECEGYAIKSGEFGEPTVLDVLENLKDLSKTIEAASQERHTGFSLKDNRKDIITSSAPEGVLATVKDQE